MEIALPFGAFLGCVPHGGRVPSDGLFLPYGRATITCDRYGDCLASLAD